MTHPDPVALAAHVADGTALPAYKPAAEPDDEWVRCSGLHCPNSERFTKAPERGWRPGGMGTWQCPKCRPAVAGSAPTT